MNRTVISVVIPAGVAVLAVGLMAWWLTLSVDQAAAKRTCIMPNPADLLGDRVEIVGKVVTGPGQPADLPGQWPSFRGDDNDNIAQQVTGLSRQWGQGQPKELWRVELGEGHAGPVVWSGRVYVMDYDRENQADALRCMSLADGQEIWRFTYPVPIKRNHGMSRTVPAVRDGLVVAISPKCYVICCDAKTGELKWKIDLIKEYGATIPQWYAGQCPLIDGDRVIIAPGGTSLMIAVDLATGNVIWKTPNPDDWQMTHASIVPIDFAGRRMYVYVASGGVVGVDAKSGQAVWKTDEWKVKIAAVPSPVVLTEGRIFLSGGYEAGAMMMQLVAQGDAIKIDKLFQLEAGDFGATQQTPIYYDDHLFGIRPGRGDKGELVCLDTAGQVTWSAGVRLRYGLGPLIIGDGLLFALTDHGELHLYEADPTACKPLAIAQAMDGHDAWGPMALVTGRLLCRDVTTLICLDVTESQQ